jgi:hypothetical protein
VSGHAHAVNAAVNGLSALPGTATPFARARAMTRFLNNPAVTFAALLDPIREAVRDALAASPARTALVVHDWSVFHFRTHVGKKDKLVRTHAADAGYELASALAADAADGRPLGPLEFRLRTADGTLTTRPTGPKRHPATSTNSPPPRPRPRPPSPAESPSTSSTARPIPSATTASGTPPDTGSSSAGTATGSSWGRAASAASPPSPRP